jgi:hypothetical protein
VCICLWQGTLLNTAVSKSARLDEFEQTQNTAIAAFAALLKDTWSVAVRCVLLHLPLLPFFCVWRLCSELGPHNWSFGKGHHAHPVFGAVM